MGADAAQFLTGQVMKAGIVEIAGLEASFLIIGAALVALMALLAVHLKRTPALSA